MLWGRAELILRQPESSDGAAPCNRSTPLFLPSTWLLSSVHQPGSSPPASPGSEKPHLHRIEGGDTAALFALILSLRARVARRLDAAIGVACCFEAGRDGFWLHRLLTTHGIANYVLEPTSILINRRARRAKTDRLDAIGMLRVLAAYLRGDRQSCSMVRVPTPEDEDAKRIHRERENLVQEKLRIENRIEALLFTQGIRKRPSLRSWERDLAVLRTVTGARCRAIFGPNWTACVDGLLRSGVDPGGRGRGVIFGVATYGDVAGPFDLARGISPGRRFDIASTALDRFKRVGSSTAVRQAHALEFAAANTVWYQLCDSGAKK